MGKAKSEVERLLTTKELADRYSMSPGSVENWRINGVGPTYVKLGKGRSSRVVYRMSDIIKFETKVAVKAHARRK